MIGKDLNGYKITDFIGKGEFGTVYKCIKNNDLYAIKIFNSDYVLNEYRENGKDNRIIREIGAMIMVNHENVIKLIDNGIVSGNENKYVYIVMEYVDGYTLEEIIKSKKLDLDEIDYIFMQIAKGLDAIHANGIVHRDLKPQNILITKDKKIKLLDFGLSKLIDFTSLTSTGNTIGSPRYMSPEQILASKSVDYRSDYYALGVIMFELITKKNPYGENLSREQLYYRILNETPNSIVLYEPTVNNCYDKLIMRLLSKKNYDRPQNLDEILAYLNYDGEEDLSNIFTCKQFEPKFYLRTWNEKTIIDKFLKDGNYIDNIIFPINHQSRQKGLLGIIKDKEIDYFFDPATMRLAYETFSNVKGLLNLSYAPNSFSKLEIEDLHEYNEKINYIDLVVKEQLNHNPKEIVAPFHFSNNSSVVTIKNSIEETWFSLDVKLLKETNDYMKKNNINKPLVGGFAIKSEILSSNKERDFFLTVLSSLPCDKYWIYVDCIDYNSSAATVYNYISTLIRLQKITNKPVVAGRVGTLGLVLIAFGLHGFESGASRFESFYEDLYQNESSQYNMYTQYYIPELMKNVSVERKNPAKIISILESEFSEEIRCTCPYCKKDIAALTAQESETRKHFLYRRQEEINIMSKMTIPERIDYIQNRISIALKYYENLKPIFKESDYSFLKTWDKVIKQLRKDYNI